jgi:hypothetical protein
MKKVVKEMLIKAGIDEDLIAQIDLKMPEKIQEMYFGSIEGYEDMKQDLSDEVQRRKDLGIWKK